MSKIAQEDLYITKSVTLKQNQDNLITRIALETHQDSDSLIQKLIDLSFESSDLTLKRTGVAHCQMTHCGKLVNVKKLHSFRVQWEVYLFCDSCFLTGTYKDLIRQIL